MKPVAWHWSSLLLLNLWILARCAIAAPVEHPSQPVPAPLSDLFGLNAIGFFHYRNAPDAAAMAQKKMDVFKQTGATWDRFDFWWGEMEPKKGEWKWDKADWLIDFYMRNHVNMLPILSYSASWMKQSPHTPEDYADFADYVARVVARYKDRVHYWEVWNEPNIPTFWKPKPDPVAYTELLKAAYNAAHKADPDCVIVGAAANETDINWLLDIAKNGGMKYMDAISIHPYSMADGPEEMDLSRQLQNVKTFLRSQGRPDLPIWITEMGWTSTINDQAAMDKAARYMVQSYVIAAAEGVQHLFWFNLQDWTENGKLEGWGLTSPELQPKTALRVYRNLVDSLKGARFSGYLPIQSGEGYVFSDLVIAWAHRHRTAILPLGAFVLIRAYSPSAVEQDKDNGLLSWEKKPTFTLAETPFGIDGVSHDLLAKVMLQRPSPETNELIINPAFEELDKNGNPYAWHKGVFYGGADKGKFGVETNVNKEHSLSLSQTSEAMWESFPVPAMPGEKYTLTAQIKTNTATGDNGVQILFLAGSGWGWRGGPTTATVTGTTDWQTVKVTGTVPDDADVVRVNLVSKNNSGTVLFRAIHLTREEAK